MPDQSFAFWLTAWDLEPSIILGLILLQAVYLLAIRARRQNTGRPGGTPAQIALFTAGILVLFLALVSPLDRLGDDYLFTAHMVQHLLLTLVAPPLLLLGIPEWFLDPLEKSPPVLSIARGLTNPYLAFLLFNLVFAVWHKPSLYDLALQNNSVHILEHLSFIGTAVLAWMPLLSPTPLLPRLAPPLQVLYLFLQSLPPTLLGAIIVFANDPLYSFYVLAPRVWGLSVMEDQTWAGLIMWIGGAFVYLLALTIVFFKWFNREGPVEGQGFI